MSEPNIANIVKGAVDAIVGASPVPLNEPTIVNNGLHAVIQPSPLENTNSYANNIKVSATVDPEDETSLIGTASIECHNLKPQQVADILKIISEG